MSDTGATFNDVPIISKRSACSLSASKHFSKLSVSFSPKKVMSGWVEFQNEEDTGLGNVITFIIHGGNRGSSSSSSLSGLLLRFGMLLVAFLDTFPGPLQLLHKGTSPCIISCSMTLPGTRMRHSRQEAVAKDP
jgi:hypothetical protein